MKTNYFKTTAAALIFTTGLWSQNTIENNKCAKLNGGFGHFSFTMQQVNISELNNSLVANGFAKINPVAPSWGGGGLFAIHNFLIGGEGASFLNSKTQNGSISVDFSGGSGFINSGYVFSVGKRSVLYPIVGFGGGSYTIRANQNNSGGSFDQHLSTPNGMVTFETGGWIINTQLAYQIFFSKAKYGYYIGLKAGYHYSPSSWKMTVNNKELSNAPKINMNGLYVTLVIGGGSLSGK